MSELIHADSEEFQTMLHELDEVGGAVEQSAAKAWLSLFGGAAPDRRGGVPDFPPQQADVANLPRQSHPALHDDRRKDTLSGKGFVEAGGR